MIERALSHGEGDSTTSAHLLAAVLTGDLQLWVVHDGPEIVAGLVVAVYIHPGKRTVWVELCAGRDLDRWIADIERLLRDFRDIVGADTVEASCRPGLAHRLGKRGWSRKAIRLELR